jgi:hypothetical protein
VIAQGILSQASASLQSVTDANSRSCPSTLLPTCHNQLRTFRGFVPYSVLPVMRSHFTPATSHVAGYVTPTGFLSLSTSCSPHNLPGLLHPGPAHGVHPSRFHSLQRCRRLFRASQPSWSCFEMPKHPDPSFRACHTAKGPAQSSNFRQTLLRLPPWASSSLRYTACCDVPAEADPSPLTLLQQDHR